MKNKKILDSKLKSLKKNNAFNKNHDKVADPLFYENDFFNPADLAQVKYEMIRKVKNNECSVKKTTELFFVRNRKHTGYLFQHSLPFVRIVTAHGRRHTGTQMIIQDHRADLA